VTMPPFVRSCLDLIDRPFMEVVFLESVFDFITLLEIDYVDAFSCDCDCKGEADKCLDRNTVTAVYDNCCKFLQSLMLRYPPMAKRYQCIIDNIHHSGHSNCSPLYNHKMSLAVSFVNASINEQKNKLLRYMETSLAFMGQIRGCVFVRYKMAQLSLRQKEINVLRRAHDARVKWNPSPTAVKVFDGVTIGFKVSMCHMVRPWELPNDLDHLKSKGFITGHPSKLFKGCDVENYTMIPSSEQRLVLWQLTEGKTVSEARYLSFIQWLRQHRPEIEPYIRTKSSGSGQYALLDVDSDRHYTTIRRVLAHWGCPDPELKFISPPLFTTVQSIIDEGGKIDSSRTQRISLYADGLSSLIEYDGRVHPEFAKEGKLSTQLVSLLRLSLDIASSSIRGKTNSEHRKDGHGDPISVTQPYIRSSYFDTGFEEFVRTGVFSPNHPAMRTFPYFEQDYLAGMSQTRRTNKRQADKAQAQHLLRVQSERFGANCNKYKARTRALTPGLFTVFCGSCGVCEYVELMPRFESPVIAFRVFAHRAWTEDDHSVMEHFEKYSLWDDCM